VAFGIDERNLGMPCQAKMLGLGGQSDIQLPKRYHAFDRFDNMFEDAGLLGPLRHPL
jgi:hypothetical protein